MPKTRSLADLYVRGKALELTDDEGPPVKVWVQKLNPIEQEKAIRKSQALRSRILSESHDEDSELYLAARAAVAEETTDTLLDEASYVRVVEKQAAIEGEVESREHWADDGYLQGLQDAWNDGLRQRYAEDPEDEEALRVYDAMKLFVDEVTEEVERQRISIRQELEETRNREQLIKMVIDDQIRSRIDIQCLLEFRKAQVWLATRDPISHKTLYFNGRAEVDELAQETLFALVSAYSELEVDPTEGKGSGESQGSSS